MVSAGGRPVDDNSCGHLSTLEGWNQFTTAVLEPPELLAKHQWQTLTGGERELYTDQRVDYHSRLGVVATSTLRRVINTGRRLTLLNRHTISARRGMVVSGAAGTGKTTAITQLGKTYQAIDRARHPRLGDC